MGKSQDEKCTARKIFLDIVFILGDPFVTWESPADVELHPDAFLTSLFLHQPVLPDPTTRTRLLNTLTISDLSRSILWYHLPLVHVCTYSSLLYGPSL